MNTTKDANRVRAESRQVEVVSLPASNKNEAGAHQVDDTVAAAQPRVTYLLGAGATHGGVMAYGSIEGVLMKDLSSALEVLTRELVTRSYPSLTELANTVITAESDFEHIITFLDESVANVDRQFAQELREIFSKVLRERLARISVALNGLHTKVYATLIDMYNVYAFGERLMGFLTLNYDDFLEAAIEVDLGRSVDYGIRIDQIPLSATSIKVLKLHGSFSWGEEWPVRRDAGGDGLWIPPGIRKKKTDYPFNLIWGSARELLDCDLLRIVGCNLGANDWDLISLLFTTKHLNASGTSFRVELITDLKTANRIKSQYPYLDARHFVEDSMIGPTIMSEQLGREEASYDSLDEEQRKEFCLKFDEEIKNPVQYWMEQMIGKLMVEADTINTPKGFVEQFVDRFAVAG